MPSKQSRRYFLFLNQKNNTSLQVSSFAATALLVLSCASAQSAPSPNSPELPALLSARDFSFGFFPTDCRRDKVDASTNDLLRFETDHNSASHTYNLPLDGKPASRWIFKQGK